MSLWSTSLLLALTTQMLFDAIKPTGAFLLFGTNCIVAGVVCLLFLKEITGLSSEQAKSVYKKNRIIVPSSEDINISVLTGSEAEIPLR
jgi:hypothetical protein